MNKLYKSTLKHKVTGTLIFSCMLLPLVYISCHKSDPEPVPVVKTLDGSVVLQNDVELLYKATLSNVNSAVLKVNHDGVLIFSEDISDVAQSGPDYQMTYKYSDDPKITKGKYEFILTSTDYASDKLEKKTLGEIPKYLPTASLGQFDLNFMEAFEANASFAKTVFHDDNPEDNPVSVTGVTSKDGKTIPTLKTTSIGYDVNVKAVPGAIGPYQLELEFGSTAGGLEKSILSGTIGKDTRIVINPLVYTDDLNAPYNSKTTRADRDAIILEELLLNPGNTVPYSATYYTCINFKYQLYIDSRKLKDKLRAPSDDMGKYWLYNNSSATRTDSIYVNGGTLANAGTIEAPILMVNLIDKSHSPPLDPFGHAMCGIISGRDKSTGSIYTNLANYNIFDPQIDEINLQPAEHNFKKDCDEVSIIYPYIVEDPINGNRLDYVTLVKFRLDNGVPTLTYENKDPKYNIIKE